MGTLEIWSAGAGSGKTHRVCEEICQRIVARGIDPAEILATTFTTAAAAELSGRIASRVLAESSISVDRRVALAERLELALIGTVHSVGHRLVRRHALSLGLSPTLDVADEVSTDRHLGRLLGELDPEPWERLGEVARRLSIEKPHDEALILLSRQRANAISDGDLRLQVDASIARLIALLDPSGKPLPGSLGDLTKEARAALASIEGIPDSTDVTAKALATLRKLARAESLSWADHASAAALGAGKKSGADGALDSIRAFGSDVRRRKAFHDDLRLWGELLVGQTIELGRRWARYKSERGLVDFVDLETLLLDLLGRPELEAELRRSLRLVVVDEFQDTNPIQLAIFLRLRELAEESVWVGDRKQAIYGFRGSDADLVDRAWSSAPGAKTQKLPKNWRSVAPLVDFAGELFAGPLGKEARLKPVRESHPAAIESWVLNPGEKKGKNERENNALAVGIADLVDSGVAPRDIAVLFRTNNGASAVASALTGLGLPVALAVPGLLGTREVQVAVAGLRLVADRGDALAAATILHLLEPSSEALPDWLPDRLRRLRAEETLEKKVEKYHPWNGHPLLAPLEMIPAKTLDPAGVVGAVIEALGLRDRLAGWGDAQRRAARLDALVDLAVAWQAEARGRGLGATVAGLIGRIEELAADKEDEIPAPKGLDAITITTYHRAKGCEWPVVVLAELGYERDPDLWKIGVSGGSPETGKPLDGRTVRLWPWPFGRSMYGGLRSGAGLAADALASPEGTTAQEAADDEALRLLYVGITRARDRVVLAHRPSRDGWMSMLQELDGLLDPALPPGSHPVSKLGTSVVVRHFDHNDIDARRRPRPKKESWLVSVPPPAAAPAIAPRWQTPSHTGVAAAPGRALVEEFPGDGRIRHRVKSADEAARLGNAVHAYLGALPSMAALDTGARERIARRCLTSWNVEEFVAPDRLVAIGDRLAAWIASRWPGSTLLTEIAVEAPASIGGHWRGTGDVVVQLPDGRAVVIDHKTAGFDVEKPGKSIEPFAPQLAAYREAFEAAGLPVAELWIHFAFDGVAVGG